MERTYAIPVARCPSCRHVLLYAKEPSAKNRVTVFLPEGDYRGIVTLCAKCKKMVAICEGPAPTQNIESEPSSRQ